MDKESITTTIIVVTAIIIIGLLSLIKSEQNTYDDLRHKDEIYNYDTTKDNKTYNYETNKNNTYDYESKNNNNNQYSSNNNTDTNVKDKLLTDLLTNKNYTNLPNTDALFYKKYEALNYTIYTQNINSYSDLNNDLIKAAVFNNIYESDISITSDNGNEKNAYVKKEFVDQRLKTLFNNNVKVKVDDYNNDTYNKYYFIKISDKVYRSISIIDLYKNKYQIHIDETYGSNQTPKTYPFPMKITSAKIFDDYILVTSKAVYLQQGVLENNKWKLWVYDKANPAMTKGAKSLGEVYVDKDHFCTVDLDKYINQASTIYTIFKKDGTNYYFYRNYINN